MQTQTKSAEPKSRFKKGDVVYLDFSKKGHKDENPRKVTVKESYFQPLTRIFMYSFEDTDICCGECYLKAMPDDEKEPLSNFFHKAKDATGFLNESMNLKEGKLLAEGMRSPSGRLCQLFFRPDYQFIEWLKKYANGRVIVDIGCGGGWLLRRLNNIGQPVIGIEPFWTAEDNMELNTIQMESGKNIINVFPSPVEDCKNFIQKLGSKALLLFARPCHSDFVENTLNIKTPDTEALYITLPKNLKDYDDLGDFKKRKKLVQHEGTSVDKEVVYSIK